MRLGTMTSSFREYRGGGKFYSVTESVRRCSEAGYKVLDMNMCALSRHQMTLDRDDWKQQADDIRNEAEKRGVVFSQSHPPFRPARTSRYDDPEQERYYCDMELRSIEISAMLGVKWAVLHPETDVNADMTDTDAQVQFNRRHFERVVELADKLNVGLAFENMFDAPYQPRRFGVTAQDLIALMDDYHSEKIGLCWDAGHGYRAYGDQTAPIMKLGSRIKATHFADNFGKDDLHLLPFMGDVRWEDVMHALFASGCEADLIYEVRINANMPDALRDATMRYTHEVGEYLLSLYR